MPSNIREAVILVSRFLPNHIGHGGVHRAYQIHYELCHSFGKNHVHVFHPPSIAAKFSSHYVSYRAYRFLKWYRKTRQNPLSLFHHTSYYQGYEYSPSVLKEYEALIEETKPRLVLVEDSRFNSFIDINKRRGIKTIACPQNLESLDNSSSSSSKWWLPRTALDFAHELQILATCDAILLISKVETGIVGGLGLPAHYYPYKPVGKITEGLDRIRGRRQINTEKNHEFLLLGSANHTSTGEGMRWFLDQAAKYGLPESIEVLLVGKGTNELLDKGVKLGGVTLKGWVEESELELLLSQTPAVLIPQWTGFGALTKITELRYAGIPVIASEHALIAVDCDEGTMIVGRHWDQWIDAMIRFTPSTTLASTAQLPTAQTSALQVIVRDILGS